MKYLIVYSYINTEDNVQIPKFGNFFLDADYSLEREKFEEFLEGNFYYLESYIGSDNKQVTIISFTKLEK
jgi:hypothetical protein